MGGGRCDGERVGADGTHRRIGGMKRIADFRVKQQEYEFKVRYAEKRARVLDYISVGY